MKARFLVALMGAGLVFAPLALSQTSQKGMEKPAMSEDMRQAIAFQRNKDVADARQARKEAIHPSVTYSDTNNRSADRSMDDSQGRPVKDPGPATVRKDQ
jgi:hypothetical protein